MVGDSLGDGAIAVGKLLLTSTAMATFVVLNVTEIAAPWGIAPNVDG